MIIRLFGLTALAWLSVVLAASAQGNPTGGLSGQVTDAQGLPLPGVTVTVESAVLQGTRSAVTSQNGDYILPFLPPGDYTASFEIPGFQSQKQTGTHRDRRDPAAQRQDGGGGGQRDRRGAGAGRQRDRADGNGLDDITDPTSSSGYRRGGRLPRRRCSRPASPTTAPAATS